MTRSSRWHKANQANRGHRFLAVRRNHCHPADNPKGFRMALWLPLSLRFHRVGIRALILDPDPELTSPRAAPLKTGDKKEPQHDGNHHDKRYDFHLRISVGTRQTDRQIRAAGACNFL